MWSDRLPAIGRVLGYWRAERRTIRHGLVSLVVSTVGEIAAGIALGAMTGTLAKLPGTAHPAAGRQLDPRQHLRRAVVASRDEHPHRHVRADDEARRRAVPEHVLRDRPDVLGVAALRAPRERRGRRARHRHDRRRRPRRHLRARWRRVERARRRDGRRSRARRELLPLGPRQRGDADDHRDRRHGHDPCAVPGDVRRRRRAG